MYTAIKPFQKLKLESLNGNNLSLINNIHNYFSNLVYSFNRTIKSMIYKSFSLQGSYNWIDNYEKILKEYNSKVHRTTGYPPKSITRDHEEILLNSVYKNPDILCKTKFKINQPVRVTRYRSVFNKSFKPQWSAEIFFIDSISRKCPVTVLLRDYKSEKISGKFYEPELQAVKNKDGYLVEKILRRRKNSVLCKWWGMGEEHNTWELEKNVF